VSGPAIEFGAVNVRLGGQDVLSEVTFAVAAGEIHCIVGPNGGGKTTLVRSLLGQVPYDGKITLDGNANPVIGYAPQSLDIDRTLPMTVLDVLAVMNQRRPAFLGRAGRYRSEQDAALDRLGLGQKTRRLFGVLSGGERQRLFFAQALVPRPDLLIMDEPTSNMDEPGVALVEGIVKEMSAQGITVLWINHDWDQVRRVAKTVTVVNRKVVAHGAPDQVLPAAGGARQAA
jgi:zinc transport system ATP-binding protein